MFGERLKLARKRAGYSLRVLADALSGQVTAQAIGKYERGEMMPSSGVLMHMAKVLGVSLEYLLSERVEELESVEFRKLSGTGAGDRARHRAVVAIARVLLHQRIAAAFGPPRRSGGVERARRNLDRRDQVIGGRFARRPEMAGLPDALRPAVLRLHAGSAVRDFSARHRPDHR